ncbi:MAG: hypothetical protein IPK20_21055 [Betaproteobacteria bacterium]|nr:hypothetical protein [Betaproteobacteria bacterium]
MIVYLALIVCSVQRQEMVACFTSIMFLYFISARSNVALRLGVLMLLGVAVLGALWVVFEENIAHEAAMWGSEMRA